MENKEEGEARVIVFKYTFGTPSPDPIIDHPERQKNVDAYNLIDFDSLWFISI